MQNEDPKVVKMVRDGFGADGANNVDVEHTEEGVRLVRAFLRIRDKNTRQLVIQLAEVLSKPAN